MKSTNWSFTIGIICGSFLSLYIRKKFIFFINIQIYNFTLHSKEFYKNDFSKLDGYIYFDIKESNKTSIKLSINTIERFKRLITITYFINKNNFHLQNGALLPSVIPTNFITCLRNYKNNKFNYPSLEDILRK